MLWKLFKKAYDRCLYIGAILCIFLMGSYFLSHSATHIAQSVYKEFGHPVRIYIMSDLDPQDPVISAVTKALDRTMSQQYTIHIVSTDLFLNNSEYNPIIMIQRDDIDSYNIDNINLISITSRLLSKIDQSDVNDQTKTIKLRYRKSEQKYVIGIPQNSYNQKLSQKLLENILIEFELI